MVGEFAPAVERAYFSAFRYDFARALWPKSKNQEACRAKMEKRPSSVFVQKVRRGFCVGRR